jgi:hypothetical protein
MDVGVSRGAIPLFWTDQKRSGYSECVEIGAKYLELGRRPNFRSAYAILSVSQCQFLSFKCLTRRFSKSLFSDNPESATSGSLNGNFISVCLGGRKEQLTAHNTRLQTFVAPIICRHRPSFSLTSLHLTLSTCLLSNKFVSGRYHFFCGWKQSTILTWNTNYKGRWKYCTSHWHSGKSEPLLQTSFAF